jgi:cephamycin C biosynthesis protein
VRNYHLALCDYQSLNVAADLVPTRLRFPAWLKDTENYSVKYNSSHRWYYWDSLAPDEAIVFKCHDSACAALAARGESAEEPDGLIDLAGLCPHTAFVNTDGPTTGRLRVSLEIRALLFYV